MAHNNQASNANTSGSGSPIQTNTQTPQQGEARDGTVPFYLPANDQTGHGEVQEAAAPPARHRILTPTRRSARLASRRSRIGSSRETGDGDTTSGNSSESEGSGGSAPSSASSRTSASSDGEKRGKRKRDDDGGDRRRTQDGPAGGRRSSGRGDGAGDAGRGARQGGADDAVRDLARAIRQHAAEEADLAAHRADHDAANDAADHADHHADGQATPEAEEHANTTDEPSPKRQRSYGAVKPFIDAHGGRSLSAQWEDIQQRRAQVQYTQKGHEAEGDGNHREKRAADDEAEEAGQPPSEQEEAPQPPSGQEEAPQPPTPVTKGSHKWWKHPNRDESNVRCGGPMHRWIPRPGVVHKPYFQCMHQYCALMVCEGCKELVEDEEAYGEWKCPYRN